MKLSAIETATLKSITESDFYEGKGSPVWTNCISYPGFTDKQLTGCLPRLSEKGLVELQGQGSDTVVYITESGYQLLGA